MKKYILAFGFTLFLNQQFKAQETAKAHSDNYDEAAFFTENDTVKKLTEVVVGGKSNSTNSSVNRAGIKTIDLPQAVQVIASEIITQQQSVRLSDVVKNANGVYVGSARGGAQESFWSRGYDMTSNNMFKNGFRFNGGSIPEVSSLDKVEILKGSAALLYGNVAPGGILNMVTKTPNFKKGGEISMQAGSYSFYKPSADVYGVINKSIAYRFNGSYENSESFRDYVTKERYYLNPSFLFKLSNKTEIIAQADYLNDDWTPDFGTGSIGKEIADVPRSTYLGAKWSDGNTKQTTASVLVNHDFNNSWKLNFNSSFQDYSRISIGTERIQPADNGDWNRPYGRQRAEEQILANQLSLQGNFKTGKIKHQLFTGVDTEISNTDAYTFRFFDPTTGNTVTVYDAVNIFDPNLYNSSLDGPILPSEVTKIVETETNRLGIYAQDLISFGEKFKALLGVRYSYQEAKPLTHDIVNDTETRETIRNDRAFSPKVGLVYQPTKYITLFSSYSNSFTPNTGVTIYNEAVKPSIIDQYEVGIKNEFLKGQLSTNVTLYQIVNSNLAQMAEFDANGNINTNNNVKALSGETTSKGIELDVTYKPMESLNIIAGYSYNDMRFTKTTGATGSFIEGDRLARTPQNTANLSFFYTIPNGVLKNLSIGAIGNYIGNRIAGWNNQINPSYPNGVWDREIPVDGYTTIDLSLGYNWNKFSLLCKLSNITNELNYTMHENYSVNPIAPRQILTSLRYKF
ncbi:TonB-dependent siderophore receptor [Flavobacterium capsici]|uniref:TonB-dependent receptor n=1 Tax=Flavobacterium capsici TaxID=3075618 RepID=A0AA96EZ97_9FLAO|nr:MULTISPECIES: TonB-dependent receptor [unclassified Flavobacterium]WNM18371.1 TonB-dependent receptor [Flavobacterium sp. PMR2A8]WNM22422.1 TonB-dependent receptor [Flavobacterium sp. PMTSA4]